MKSYHVKQGTFKCTECEKIFTNEIKLKNHKWRHSTANDKVKCNYCNALVHKYSIKEHKQSHVNVDNGTYQCKYCKRNFGRQWQLRSHLLTHEGKKNAFKCNQCDKSYKKIEYVNKHIRYIHKKSEVGKWICK